MTENQVEKNTNIENKEQKVINISEKSNNSSMQKDFTMTTKKKDMSVLTEKFKVTIKNNTDLDSTTGLDYAIEYYKNSKWEKISLNMNFNSLGIEIQPQKSENFTIYLYPEQYNYIKGKYRVRKTIKTEEKTYQLFTTFTLS